MLAWVEYRGGLHEPCGHPTETAFHPDNDGWFQKVGEYTCHACTAAKEPEDDGTRKPVTIPIVVDTRDYEKRPLPPWPVIKT